MHLALSNVPLLVALAATVFVAGALTGTTGLGFAQLSAAALALVTDAKTAVILLSIMVPLSSGRQAFRHWKHRGGASRVAWLLAGALAGVPVGVYLLEHLPPQAIELGLGLFTLAFVVTSFHDVRVSVPAAAERFVTPLVGLAAGTSSGAIGVSGPILASYLLALRVPALTFSFTISVLFVSMAVLRLLDLVVVREVTAEIFAIGLILLIPGLVGQQIGFALGDRIDARTFERIVLGVLFLAAISLLLRGFGV